MLPRKARFRFGELAMLGLYWIGDTQVKASSVSNKLDIWIISLVCISAENGGWGYSGKIKI